MSIFQTSLCPKKRPLTHCESVELELFGTRQRGCDVGADDALPCPGDDDGDDDDDDNNDDDDHDHDHDDDDDDDDDDDVDEDDDVDDDDDDDDDDDADADDDDDDDDDHDDDDDDDDDADDDDDGGAGGDITLHGRFRAKNHLQTAGDPFGERCRGHPWQLCMNKDQPFEL